MDGRRIVRVNVEVIYDDGTLDEHKVTPPADVLAITDVDITWERVDAAAVAGRGAEQ